jgi:uncharacterized protein (TIGR03067 family)
MRRLVPVPLLAFCLLTATYLAVRAGEDAKDPLQGVWAAQSVEADGKPAPAEAVKRMRFTFKGDKLLVRGNHDDDREEECPCTVDPKQTPKHLDFTPPKEQKAVLGIYELKGDELKVCVRHASSSEGRPTEFATKAGSKLVLIVFKKQKPEGAGPIPSMASEVDGRTANGGVAENYPAPLSLSFANSAATSAQSW